MPRSKDPRNYGPFYEKLGELMDRGESDIRLKMPGRLAIYHRNNFYAYINAWKCEIDRIQKSKVIPGERKGLLTEHALRMEDVLRRYLVVINPEANPELEEVELRFVLRGMDERQVHGIAQLDELLAQSTGMTFEEVSRQLQGQAGFMAVDGKKVIADWMDMTGGPDVALEDMDTSDVTDEDIAALSNDPPIHDELSDLITESNSPASETKDEYIRLMTGHLKSEDKEK